MQQYRDLRTQFIPELLKRPEAAIVWNLESLQVRLDCGLVVADLAPSRVSLVGGGVRRLETVWGPDLSLHLGSSSILGKKVVVYLRDSEEEKSGTIVGITDRTLGDISSSLLRILGSPLRLQWSQLCAFLKCSSLRSMRITNILNLFLELKNAPKGSQVYDVRLANQSFTSYACPPITSQHGDHASGTC